jgi:hypothetical protein
MLIGLVGSHGASVWVAAAGSTAFANIAPVKEPAKNGLILIGDYRALVNLSNLGMDVIQYMLALLSGCNRG